MTDERLNRLLDDLGPADAPAGFSRDVWSRIEAERIVALRRTIPFSENGIVRAKKAMWGLAGAAAVVFIVFLARGFPIVDRGTEGAIGAAKKYQRAQIAAGDVALGDSSAQPFMQSDTFARLLKDPAAVKALSDATLRQQLADPSLIRALQDPQLAALSKQSVDARLLGAAIQSEAFQHAIRSNGFNAALRDRRFAEAMAASASRIAGTR